MSTYQPPEPLQAVQLRCPLCHGTQFQTEVARSESKWGFTNHKMTLKVCLNCRFVLHFYDNRSMFDVD
ncbi:hypothetical protein ACSDQ9_06050 [Aestuariimicrobium soli]|uniref:hypothetical protein n=1 Tax=Aestuariimicrobium soli TaxID=2035834 RepID=UPI003EC0C336